MDKQESGTDKQATDATPTKPAASPRSTLGWIGLIARRLLRLCLSLLLRTLLFCLIALGLILFTQSGREWLITELVPELLHDSPLQIEITGFNSPDPGHWQFSSLDLVLNGEAMFSARQFLLKFDFPKLLIAQIDIHELSAQHINIHLPESSEQEESESVSLDQWRDYLLPIQVHKLALDHLEFSPTNPNLPAMQVHGDATLMGPEYFLASELMILWHHDSQTALHLIADLDSSFDGRLQLSINEQAGGWLGKLIQLPDKQAIKMKADLISQRKDHKIQIDLRSLSSPWADFMLNIQGQAEWDTRQQRLNLPSLNIQIDQNKQHLSGWWQAQNFDLQAQLNHLPVALFAPFQSWLSTGSLSGVLNAKGSTSDPVFDAKISLATHYSGQPLALELQADGNLQALAIQDALLNLGDAQLRTSGTVSADKQQFDLKIHSLSGPLAILTLFEVPLPEGLKVDIQQTKGRLYGPFTAPFYEGRTKGKVEYSGQAVSVESDFKGDIHKLELRDFDAQLKQGRLKAEGSIDWSAEQLALQLDAQSFPLSLLSLAGIDLPPALSADVSAQGALSGSFSQPFYQGTAAAEGRFAKSRFSIRSTLDSSPSSVQLKALTALISLKDQKPSDAPSLFDQEPAEQVAKLDIPTLNYQLATKRIVSDISASKVPYQFAALANINLPDSLQGTVDAELQLDGSLPFPAVKGQLSSQGQFEGEDFSLAFSGQLADAQLQLDEARLNWHDTEFSIHGKASEQELDISARLDKLNLADLAKFGITLPSGRLGMELNLSGSRQAPAVKGKIQLQADVPLLFADHSQEQPLFITMQLQTEQQTLHTQTHFRQGQHEQGWLNVDTRFMPLLNSILNKDEHLNFAELPLAIQANGELKLSWLNIFIAQYIHRFDGSLRLNTEISGTLNKPLVNGRIEIQQARYQNVYSQSAIEDAHLNVSIEDNYVSIQKSTARVAAGGQLALNGHINFAAHDDEQFNLVLTLLDAALLNREDVMGKASGELKVAGDLKNILVSGAIKINPFQLMVEKISLDSIPEIEVTSKQTHTRNEASPYAMPLINLDILVELDQKAYIRGRGIDAELAGHIELSGHSGSIQTKGQFKTIRGQFEVFNKVFKLESGNVLFSDDNVQLNIQGRYKGKDMDFIAALTGTLNNPEISLRTVPALPEDEALARLLFGRSISNISAIQAIQLASALQTLRGEGGDFDPLGEARKLLNVDRLNIESQENSEGKGIAIGVGKYLTDKIYIEATRTPEPAQPWKGSVEVELNPNVILETTTGGSSGFGGVELKWKKDY